LDGGSIAVELRSNDDCTMIEVLDRGPGIGRDDQHLLFQPFWRRDGSRSRDAGGTGLGLSVVASIVRAHGGRVVAENREGGGAKFRILLPRDRAA